MTGTPDDSASLLRGAQQRLAVARATGFALGFAVLASLLLAPLLRETGFGDVIGFAGLAAAGVWLFLGMAAARQGRRVREAAALASAGRVDLAEGRSLDTLGAFCLLRPVTVGAAAVLARVRHAQGRFAEAARLAAFVVARPERSFAGEKRGVRLLLAESLLASDDVAGAAHAVLPLYAPPTRREGPLTLAEALRLLAVQLTVDSQAGRLDAVRDGIGRKLAMVELMTPRESARLTAVLRDAAAEGGESFAAWAEFLSRRAAILGAPA